MSAPRGETMTQAHIKRGGDPFGFRNLDIDRPWALIDHRKRDTVPVEWMDPSKFDSMLRAAVVKRLLSRIEGRLYQTLGDEMVKAELDIEHVILKVEAAAQAFGTTTEGIEKLVAETGRTAVDF